MNHQSTQEASYSTFVLSVDDLGWTKHWLGKLRCDQILVYVAQGSDAPKIHIRAVESKATSEVETLEPAATVAPFSEGIRQVASTLDALWSILRPPEPDPLVEDLRFSSFIEHLASIALSDLYPLQRTDLRAINALKTITDFSLRTLSPEQITLDGVVVCTQYRANVNVVSRQYTHDINGSGWTIFLVRAGMSEIDALLGPQAGGSLHEMLKPMPEPRPPREDSSEGKASAVHERSEDTKSQAKSISGDVQAVDINQSVGENTAASPAPLSDTQDATVLQVAQDLHLACRQRGIPVEPPEHTNIIVGPTLLSIAMALQAGSSIRRVETAVEDIAREVGVANVLVENDPDRAFHVRFLVARREREFPPLPDNAAPLVDRASQSYLGLYLGKNLEGSDFLSYVSTWPHILIGGTTGSGKTTFMRSLLLQLRRFDPTSLDIIVIDGKGEIDYLGVLSSEYFSPRFPEVLLGYDRVLEVLNWIVEEEIPSRRKTMLERANSNPGGRPRLARDLYTASIAQGKVDPFPPLIVVVDEFAELMLADRASAQSFEQRVQQVVQTGRSTLVHFVLATQRPDASVVRGAIKTNIPARIALKLPTHHDSTTTLGHKGAEQLLGDGDLIYQASDQPPVRLQGYSV